MKRFIHSEYDDLVKVYRITIDVFYEKSQDVVSTDILPLQNEDGTYDELALDYYNDFIVNALEVFDDHDYEVIEEQESPYSKSYYFSLVKKDDLENYDYKYILFIRLSDHDNRKESKQATKKFYDDKAQSLKQPKDKRRQTWRLKEITVNRQRFETYEQALEEIDKRLSSN